jgi:hypothetical protein
VKELDEKLTELV